MPKNILICRSNPIAPDPRVEKIARCLVKAGSSVDVIAWDRSGELAVSDRIGAIRIRRLPIRAKYARGVMNLLPLLRWQLGLLFWLVRNRKGYEVIHACDFDTVLPALFSKIFFGKKVVYDIFDFYADHLRATPEWLKKLIRAVDFWTIARVDAVILVDDARKQQIAGAKPRRLAVIYNTPEEQFEQIKRDKREEDGQLCLAYIGLLQTERGLLYFLEALKMRPQWRLDLAGFGGDEAQILAIAENMSNVIWHGRVSYQTTLELSVQADVLFALYDPSIPNHRYSSPNKLFEAMMLGKPFLVARGTNMDRIAEEEGFGILVKYGDKDDLIRALDKLAGDVQLRKELGKRARLAYEKKYGWPVMSKRLIELYDELD